MFQFTSVQILEPFISVVFCFQRITGLHQNTSVHFPSGPCLYQEQTSRCHLSATTYENIPPLEQSVVRGHQPVSMVVIMSAWSM